MNDVTKRKMGLRLMALTLLPVLLLATGGVLGKGLLAEPGNYQEVTFDDSEATNHAGPGPDPEFESNKYNGIVHKRVDDGPQRNSGSSARW
jgi:hypothetical protein